MKIKHMNSTQTLYILFVLTLICLGIFIMRNDTESLFLFISIALIVYFLEDNLIYVLGVPLIFVNIMIILKSFTKPKIEGFESLVETMTDDEKKMVGAWIKEKVESSDDMIMDYEMYKTSIDKANNIKPLKKIIESIVSKDFKDDDVDLTPIDNFVDYVKKIEELDNKFTEMEMKDNENANLFCDSRDEIKFTTALIQEINLDMLTAGAVEDNSEDVQVDDDDEDDNVSDDEDDVDEEDEKEDENVDDEDPDMF